jgi:hypothetical protein
MKNDHQMMERLHNKCIRWYHRPSSSHHLPRRWYTILHTHRHILQCKKTHIHSLLIA